MRAEFGDARVKGRARNILAAMLVSRTGLRPAEVSRRLGVSRSAVTKSVLRVDEIVRNDPAVARKVRGVTAEIESAAKTRFSQSADSTLSESAKGG